MTTTFSRPIGEKLRVVVVDDHDLIREGLKHVLAHEDDMEVVGEGRNGEEAIRVVHTLRPTILLVDVSMPGMSGVEVTRVIRRACPTVRVIGVTRHRENGFVTAMLEAGAAGYVLKQSPSDELTRAVRSVAAGEQYLDRSLTGAERISLPAAPRPAPDQRNEGATLNETEERVLQLLARSQSNQEIAQELSISPDEVRTIKSAAMQKAGLATRVQVAEYVRARGGKRR